MYLHIELLMSRVDAETMIRVYDDRAAMRRSTVMYEGLAMHYEWPDCDYDNVTCIEVDGDGVLEIHLFVQ